MVPKADFPLPHQSGTVWDRFTVNSVESICICVADLARAGEGHFL